MDGIHLTGGDIGNVFTIRSLLEGGRSDVLEAALANPYDYG